VATWTYIGFVCMQIEEIVYHLESINKWKTHKHKTPVLTQIKKTLILCIEYTTDITECCNYDHLTSSLEDGR
jgi:hypothetical protein